MTRSKKRQDILDAAIAEFREHGFAGATMSRIAGRAAVSSRTLYKHFNNKNALFDAIVEAACQSVNGIEIAEPNPDRPLKPQLLQLVKTYVNEVTREEHVALDEIATVAFIRDQRLTERATQHQSNKDHPVYQFVEKASRLGLLSCEQPEFAARQLLIMIKGFFCTHILLPGELADTTRDKDKVLSDCVDMFLAQYQPHQAG